MCRFYFQSVSSLISPVISPPAWPLSLSDSRSGSVSVCPSSSCTNPFHLSDGDSCLPAYQSSAASPGQVNKSHANFSKHMHTSCERRTGKLSCGKQVVVQLHTSHRVAEYGHIWQRNHSSQSTLRFHDVTKVNQVKS